MKAPNKPFGRGPQILSVLAKHGPLSARGLTAILIPVIQRKKLNEVLGRLLRRRLIIKLQARLFGDGGIFYQINQNPKVWGEISLVTGLAPKSLFQPQFRSVELLHSESCAVWAVAFERLNPLSILLRDFSLRNSQMARQILLEIDNDIELIPDLLIVQLSEDGKTLVSVAVEIERYMKTDMRTLIKLKRFAAGSRLDGVIWLCDNDGIAERLKRLYNTRVKDRAHRISNYGSNFMLFQNECFPSSRPTLNLQNAASESVDFNSWIGALQSKNSHERFDVNFNVRGAGHGRLQYA